MNISEKKYYFFPRHPKKMKSENILNSENRISCLDVQKRYDWIFNIVNMGVTKLLLRKITVTFMFVASEI